MCADLSGCTYLLLSVMIILSYCFFGWTDEIIFQVLCFNDFSPCAVTQSPMNALISVDWKKYGLSLRSIVDQNGSILVEWEDLPTHAHIDIAIHCYHKQYPLLHFMHLFLDIAQDMTLRCLTK